MQYSATTPRVRKRVLWLLAVGCGIGVRNHPNDAPRNHPNEKELAFLLLASEEQLEPRAVLDCIPKCLLSLLAQTTAIISAQDGEATMHEGSGGCGMLTSCIGCPAFSGPR